jgi:hypothetical protein
MTWRRLLLLLAWVLIIPPITPAKEGIYIGPQGHPANVGIADPLFMWTVVGRFPSGAECKKKESALEVQSLQLDPTDARTVAYSFAKCLQDTDPLIQRNNRRAW